MLDNLNETLVKRCQILPTETVLVGVSGGPDSLCLLDVLHRLGVPLVVAHLNHSLRPEASADAHWVQKIAQSRDLQFVMGKEDVSAYAESQRLSLEEAARTLRYRFLFSKAEECNAQAVAVGHSADDQVETVLMHLLRGSGLSGLKGMAFRALPNAWSAKIALVRPLLEIWREDILRYLSERNLEPLIDRTNLDLTLFRNRLRHELIPYLESYNPAIRRIAWRMSTVLSADYAVLQGAIASAWGDCLIERDYGYVALDAGKMKQRPLGLQRHIFRQAIEVLRPGLRDIGFHSIDRAVDFLENPPAAKQQDLIAGLRLLLEGNRLWVAAWEADLPGGRWPQLPDRRERELEIPGVVQLPVGWLLEANPIEAIEEARAQALVNRDPFQAWLDGDKLPRSLSVRARHPGDRFQPLGMEGHSVKLADFMVNVKLPRRARAHWPLVCAGDEIVWLPGFRLGHPFRLIENTREVIHIILERRAVS